MPSGENVIGKVSVKVIPDTGDFRRDLQDDLDAIERGLKIQIGIELDNAAVTRLREDVRALVRELSAGSDVQVNVDLDEAAAEGEIERLRAELAAIGDAKIHVDVDDAVAKHELDDLTHRLDEHQTLHIDVDDSKVQSELDRINTELDRDHTVHVQVEVDDSALTRLRAELDALKNDLKIKVSPQIDNAAMDKVQHDIDELGRKDVTVGVHPNYDNGAGAVVRARIDLLTRPQIIDIVVKLNNEALVAAVTEIGAISGGRAVFDATNDLRKFLAELDKVAPKIGLLASAFTTLGIGAVSSAANLASLLGSLGAIGGVALALPGIFGGLAVGIGISVAAFKDLNKAVPELKDKMKELHNVIDANFFAQFTAPFRALVDDLFPRLKQELSTTSNDLGNFFGKIANEVRVQLSPTLHAMFENLNKSIEIFTEFGEHLVGIITQLGFVGSELLPRLAQFVGELAAKFDDFLAKADSNGNLRKWINDGIKGFEDLGRILFNLGGIFAGVARAAEAAGGSVLTTFADHLEQIHKVVDSPGFQDGLTRFFASAINAFDIFQRTVGEPLKQLLKVLANILDDVMPKAAQAFGDAISAVLVGLNNDLLGNGIRAFFDDITKSVTIATPLLQDMGTAFNALLPVIGQLIIAFAKVAEAGLKPLVDGFTKISPQISEFIDLFSTKLVEGINKAVPILRDAFKSIGPELGDSLRKLADAIPGIVENLGKLAAAVIKMAPDLIDLSTTFALDLLPGFTKLAEKVVPLVGAFNDLVQAVSPLAKVFGEIAALFGGGFIDGLTHLFEGLAKSLQAIQQGAKAVTDFFSGIRDLFTGDFPGAIQKLKDSFTDLGQTLLRNLSGAFDLGLAALLLVPITKAFALVKAAMETGIRDIFVNLPAVLTELGKNLVDSITSILGAMLIAFHIEKIREIFDSLPQIIGTALQTLFSTVLAAVQAGWTAITAVFTAALPAIQATMTAGWAAIQAVVSAAWTAIQTVISTVMTAIQTVITTGWTLIQTVVTTAMTAIQTAVQLGWTLLTTIVTTAMAAVQTAVQLAWTLIQTIITTAMTTIQTLVQTGWTLIQTIVTTVLTAIQTAVQVGWTLIQTIITTVMAAIQTAVQTAWAAIQATVSAAVAAVQAVVTAGWSAIQSATSAAMSAIRSAVQSGWSAIQGSISSAMSTIQGAVSSGFSAVTGSVSSAMSTMRSAVQSGISAVIGLFQSMVSQITSLAGNFGSLLVNAGKALIQGLISGIKSMVGSLMSTIGDIASSILSKLGGLLGIHSPSTVFAELGRFTMLGFIDGLESQYADVHKSLEGLASSVAGTTIGAPQLGAFTIPKSLAMAVTNGMSGGAQVGVSNTLIYNAAPGGAQLSAEEDLFAAAGRARLGWGS